MIKYSLVKDTCLLKNFFRYCFTHGTQMLYTDFWMRNWIISYGQNTVSIKLRQEPLSLPFVFHMEMHSKTQKWILNSFTLSITNLEKHCRHSSAEIRNIEISTYLNCGELRYFMNVTHRQRNLSSSTYQHMPNKS